MSDGARCPDCGQMVRHDDMHFECPADPLNRVRAERRRIVALLDAAMDAPTHDLAYINVIAVVAALRKEGT